MRRQHILPTLMMSAGLACLAAGPVSASTLGSIFAPAQQKQPMLVAQSAEAAARTQQLEEAVRQLNGKIEDLNFQLLQMQEQLRKMQEDNEYRFQELEGGGRRGMNNGGTASDNTAVASVAPARGTQQSENDQVASIIQKDALSSDEGSGDQGSGDEMFAAPSGSGDNLTDGATDSGTEGLKTETLGSLVFDKNGSLVGATSEKPIDLTGTGNGQVVGQNREVASLELPNDPDQLYELGYNYIQSGDYALAEGAFESFSERFPDNPRIGEARFWLGESMLSRGMYEEAAKVLLDAHKKYPESRMAAQTLLKLGVSLAGMDQRELACATYAEIPKQYPQMSGAVRAKVATEQKASNCKAG